jgi:hypothetical protein
MTRPLPSVSSPVHYSDIIQPFDSILDSSVGEATDCGLDAKESSSSPSMGTILFSFHVVHTWSKAAGA